MRKPQYSISYYLDGEPNTPVTIEVFSSLDDAVEICRALAEERRYGLFLHRIDDNGDGTVIARWERDK